MIVQFHEEQIIVVTNSQ